MPFHPPVPLGCTAVARTNWDRSLHLCLTGEEAESGPHWPHASGSLGVQSSFYSFVLLHARAVPCDSGSGCRSGLRCSGYSGCRLGGGPRVEEGCVGGAHPAPTRPAAQLLPLGGRCQRWEGPAPSSWLGDSGVWERKPLFLLCLLVAYFLRLAPRACGFAWDPIRLCCSPLCKFSSPLEPWA